MFLKVESKAHGSKKQKVHEDYRFYEVIGRREFDIYGGDTDVEYANGRQGEIRLSQRGFDREATPEELQRAKESQLVRKANISEELRDVLNKINPELGF